MKTLEISDLRKVESSNIHSVGFDGGKIYVKFNNGGLYAYSGATVNDYEEFSKAESVGKHFHSHIKSLEAEKLEDTELKLKGLDSNNLSSYHMNQLTEQGVEITRLRKENEDLFLALRIKQEKIDAVEDRLNKVDEILRDLFVLQHHKIEEELWRIQDALLILEGKK